MGAQLSDDGGSKEDKVALIMEPLRADPGRAAAVSRKLHTNILPIFLLMATLCYIDRCEGAISGAAL